MMREQAHFSGGPRTTEKNCSLFTLRTVRDESSENFPDTLEQSWQSLRRRVVLQLFHISCGPPADRRATESGERPKKFEKNNKPKNERDAVRRCPVDVIARKAGLVCLVCVCTIGTGLHVWRVAIFVCRVHEWLASCNTTAVQRHGVMQQVRRHSAFVCTCICFPFPRARPTRSACIPIIFRLFFSRAPRSRALLLPKYRTQKAVHTVLF